ncbi:MAG: tyrosine-type recombinase/integrase [Chloroflexota bacterium]|nr:tyrosine-type recombinase/integrase [Chloroflexota bacterium]
MKRSSARGFLYVETLGCPERVAGLRNRKKTRALPRHMTEQEVECLILATPDLRHRAAFITAYAAGLRVSETVTVKVGDIKSDRKRLHVPSGKGGAESLAPWPDGVIDYLRGYWKNIWPHPASWLFYGASPDKPLSVAALHHAFKAAREKVGINPRHSFHTFRHSTATHVLERGADMEVIRDALGHRSADTTRGYLSGSGKQQTRPKKYKKDV